MINSVTNSVAASQNKKFSYSSEVKGPNLKIVLLPAGGMWYITLYQES